MNKKSNMTSKYGTNFVISIRHYKWEDCEIDADRKDASRLQDFPAETHSNNSGIGIPNLSLIYLGYTYQSFWNLFLRGKVLEVKVKNKI